MDHGVLNVPLSKRGDIDRALDAHKAAQRRQAKAQAKESAQYTRAMRAQARKLVAEVPAELWERIGAAAGLSAKAAERLFRSEAFHAPAKVAAALSREQV